MYEGIKIFATSQNITFLTRLYQNVKIIHWLREDAKKVLFLGAPPLGLVVIGTFFLTLKKVSYSLVAHMFSPLPLLVARPPRKELLFFSDSATKRGGWVWGAPLRKKYFSFNIVFLSVIRNI